LPGTDLFCRAGDDCAGGKPTETDGAGSRQAGNAADHAARGRAGEVSLAVERNDPFAGDAGIPEGGDDFALRIK
jgi:hypothetical protein